MSDAGIVFGNHSLTHFQLTRCNNIRLQAEVVDSKKIIEDHIGREVKHFCYPYTGTAKVKKATGPLAINPKYIKIPVSRLKR